jgi:hypothetical protein
MNDEHTFLSRFFHVALEGKTYLHLLYLLMMLPLGIIYFTLVVTGVSLSIGLLILIIGIAIAFIFLMLIRGISTLHLHFASALLGFDLPPSVEPKTPAKGFIDHFKTALSDSKTYSSIIYMIVELPLGIFYFTLIVTFVCISLVFTVSPVLWILLNEGKIPISDDGWLWRADFGDTVFLMLVGIVLFFATLHLGNLLAKLEKFLCKNWLARV